MADDARTRWSLRRLWRLDVVARCASVFACLFFAAVCFWEAFSPPDCGHFCSTAEVAIGGTNMWRFHIFAAVNTLVRTTPGPDLHYTHHPYGVYLSAALFTRIFGPGVFGMRASGIVTGALTAPLVYLVSRRLVPALHATIATVLFVFLPIDLAFARFGSLEGLTMFWGMVYCFGTLKLFETWRTRYLVVACLGALGAAQSDWIGAVFVALVLLPSFVRGYVLPLRIGERVDARRFTLWFVLSIVGLLSSLVYLLLFARENRLADLVGSYGSRSAGAEIPVLSALSPRRTMWIRWTLPLYVLWLAPVGAVLSTAQLIRGRREHAVVVAWFVMATVQYFLFKQGADIHIFWPHYYGISVALGGAVTTCTVAAAWRRLASHLPTWAQRAGLVAGLSLLAATGALLGREGLAQLWQSRITSGRFDESGSFVDSFREPLAVVRWAYASVPAQYDLAIHSSVPETPNLSYSMQRPTRHADLTAVASGDPGRYAIVDLRNIDTAQARSLAKTFSIVAAGPFARVDRASGPSEPYAVPYRLRAPTVTERAFVLATEPIVDVGESADPFATWELRDWLGVPQGARLPAPASIDEKRIALNESASTGDLVRARLLLDEIRRELRAPPGGAIDFTNAVSLIGVRLESLGGSVATLFFATGPTFAPFRGDFTVSSRVVAPPTLWVSGTDFHTRDVAPRAAIRPDTWRPNSLYAMRFKVLPRIGREEFTGRFVGEGAPRPVAHDGQTLFITGR